MLFGIESILVGCLVGGGYGFFFMKEKRATLQETFLEKSNTTSILGHIISLKSVLRYLLLFGVLLLLIYTKFFNPYSLALGFLLGFWVCIIGYMRK